jgi:hypothetical protein
MPDNRTFPVLCRVSSMCATPVPERTHRRSSSTAVNVNTSQSDIINRVEQGTINASKMVSLPSSSLTNEILPCQLEADGTESTHAYRMPYRSNIGSQSVFINLPSKMPLSPNVLRTHSMRDGRQTVSCPFYAMYLANLTVQQRKSSDKQRTHINELVRHQQTLTQQTIESPLPVNSYTNTACAVGRFDQRIMSTSIVTNNPHPRTNDDSKSRHSHNRLTSTKSFGLDRENSSRLDNAVRTSSLTSAQV